MGGVEQDKFVTLVNPEGVEEQVWDFANHVNQLLTQGWKVPTKKSVEQKQIGGVTNLTIKTDKEI